MEELSGSERCERAETRKLNAGAAPPDEMYFITVDDTYTTLQLINPVNYGM